MVRCRRWPKAWNEFGAPASAGVTCDVAIYCCLPLPDSVPGYSDRINHALAFAAKHHDQQVRKGTRSPYLTQPANVAIMLTAYGRSESTVVAGILHDVLADYVRDGLTRDALDQRVGEKFGADVVETLLAIIPRRSDSDGVELAADERRSDVLTRVSAAPDEAKWVCCADQLHGAASLATDLRRTVDPAMVWARQVGGRDGALTWYRNVCNSLSTRAFAAPIMVELQAAVSDLERQSAS